MRKDFLIEETQALLDLFHESVPDKDSNRLVWLFCEEPHRWPEAHGLFRSIRGRTLEADRADDSVRASQYLFEEVIAKTLFNLTGTSTPFDSDSPYWIIKNALVLAKKLDIPAERVLEIVA